MHLGAAIKQIRQIANVNQGELAAKINKTRALVSHIEQSGKVNYYTLQAIAKALQVTVSYIEDYPNATTKPTKATPPIIDDKEINHLLREIELLNEQVLHLKKIVALQEKLLL